jgi:hypothetical protein
MGQIDGEPWPHDGLEYVRFFVEHHGDQRWVDMGLAAVEVGGKTGRRSTTYRAELACGSTDRRRLESSGGRLRAVLAYEVEPPADEADWRPIWGDVLDGCLRPD